MRPKIQRLKDKAWKTFSLFIRNRDKKCVTCDKVLPVELLQAGHFFHGVLDFDEENINAQDARCNKWLSGNLAPYSVYLLGKLGKKKFDALNIRHYRAMGGEKRSEQDYLNIIEKYK